MSIPNITEWLLFHIWKKSSAERQSGKPTNIGVLVPSTLIYRWAQPLCWYFTGSDGCIRRKKKDNIEMKQIEDVYLEKKSKTGIVATAMYCESRPSKLAMIHTPFSLPKGEKKSNSVYLEYLNETQFSK